MIKEEKLIKEQIVRHIYCDVCGKEIERHYNHHCYMCGKDLCTQCAVHIEYDEDDNDYVYSYCKSCWEKGEKYRNEINRHYEEIDRLQDEWDNECKQNNLNKNEKSNR